MTTNLYDAMVAYVGRDVVDAALAAMECEWDECNLYTHLHSDDAPVNIPDPAALVILEAVTEGLLWERDRIAIGRHGSDCYAVLQHPKDNGLGEPETVLTTAYKSAALIAAMGKG